MNKDTLHGDWNVVKGKIKEKWGKLTDDDLTEIKGKRDQLLGKLQKKYGFAKERAEQELSEWEKCCDHECKSKDQDAREKETSISAKHTSKP